MFRGMFHGGEPARSKTYTMGGPPLQPQSCSSHNHPGDRSSNTFCVSVVTIWLFTAHCEFIIVFGGPLNLLWSFVWGMVGAQMNELWERDGVQQVRN